MHSNLKKSMEKHGHVTIWSLCPLGLFTPSVMWKNRYLQYTLIKVRCYHLPHTY